MVLKMDWNVLVPQKKKNSPNKQNKFLEEMDKEDRNGKANMLGCNYQ